MNLNKKYESLKRILYELGRVVVAYSGGVDSTFLLKVAVDTLGAENVLACIATGPSLPQSQYVRAIELAKNMGVNVQSIEPNEMADARYTSNEPDRCFYCKIHLFELLTKIAEEQNFTHIICGHNLDDQEDYRPGNKAANNFGIRSPLAEAKLTKNDIRQLSRQLGLPTADIPASPCLASRMAYGLEITEQRLKQIEQAEEFLKELGFVEFRVRLHDNIARIEVHTEDIEKIIKEPTRSQLIEKLRSLGFNFVTVDLQGFRSGSLNEPITEDQKQKTEH